MMDDTYRLDPCPTTPFWVATETYTAECPAGKVGVPVTVTRQARSYRSMEEARALALCHAKREAEAELQCQFFSRQCVNVLGTVLCGTAFSEISQADADDKALEDAQLG